MISQTKHPKALNISVVGATGIVGKEFLKILAERNFPCARVKLFASRKSAGEKITFQGQSITVEELKPGCFEGDDISFFSAGADISKEWAPQAAKSKAFVIDNSSAFRMEKDIPLVVPEVNPKALPALDHPSIIANPNCSTIQLVVALKPLHDHFTLKNVTVATYQSVAGAGKEGQDELKNHTQAFLENKPQPANNVFAHTIAFNNIPQIDKFNELGYTLEEMKVVNETRKIMDLPNLEVSVTAVRTPTMISHCEAVWVEVDKVVQKSQIIEALKKAEGITIQDDPQNNVYPLNSTSGGKDDVYVGRIRQDLSNPKRWLLWVVSDNVRKGAALNGVQIAQKLFDL